MDPFLVAISLRSPIILGHRMMFDSLLMAVHHERYGASLADDLPIQVTDGILHASQMLLGIPDVPLVGSTTLISSFLFVLTREPVVTAMLDKQPAPSSMSHGSGPNSNMDSTYVTHSIPRVYFLGVGDIKRIRGLLMTLVHVGSQAHKGYGEVEQVTVTKVNADPRWFGVVGRYHDQSIVLRPVPKRLVHLLPRGTYGFDSAETWRYPYFPGSPTAAVEACMVPPFAHGEGFHRDAIRGFYTP